MKTSTALSSTVLVTLGTGVAFAQTPSFRINVGVDPEAMHASTNVRLAAVGTSVYALWMDDRSSSEGITDLYFNRSLDGGATWMASDVRIDVGFAGPLPTSSASHHVAAQGASVYAVWAEREPYPYTRPFGVFANRSEDGGAAWLDSSLRISEDLDQHVSKLDMAADGSKVYVVWEDDRDGVPAIYFDRSLDGGLTWMPQDVRIATSGSQLPLYDPFDSALDLAVCEDDVYVAWEDDRNAYPLDVRDIYLNRSLDGGLTWLPNDVRIDVGGTLSGDSRHPELAVQGSAVYVVWDDDVLGERDVYFNRSLDHGATWLPRAVRLDRGTPNGAFASNDPRIAAVGSEVFVVWSDRRNEYGDVYFNRSLDAGTTWQAAAVRLDTGDEPGSVHSDGLQVQTEGAVVLVAWHDYERTTPTEPGFDRIGFNRSTDGGETWLPAHVYVSDSDRARGPSLASGASSAYLAWWDTRNPRGWADIYFTMPVGHQAYGAGTPGTGGFVPTLTASTLPCIGTSLAWEVDKGLGGAVVVLLGGLGGRTVVPFAGGALLLQAPYFQTVAVLGGTPGAAGEGAASIPVPIPSDVGLIGLRVNGQAGVIDPAARRSVALTGALESWVL